MSGRRVARYCWRGAFRLEARWHKTSFSFACDSRDGRTFTSLHNRCILLFKVIIVKV